MGGCCGGSGYTPKDSEDVARDPVCGMKVDCSARDVLKISHDGKDFYFCSTMCLTKFTNNPEAYKEEERCFFGLFKKKQN